MADPFSWYQSDDNEAYFEKLEGGAKKTGRIKGIRPRIRRLVAKCIKSELAFERLYKGVKRAIQ